MLFSYSRYTGLNAGFDAAEHGEGSDELLLKNIQQNLAPGLQGDAILAPVTPHSIKADQALGKVAPVSWDMPKFRR